MSINEQTTTIQCDWKTPLHSEEGLRAPFDFEIETCGEEITFYQARQGKREPVNEHGRRTLDRWVWMFDREYCPRHAEMMLENGLTIQTKRLGEVSDLSMGDPAHGTITATQIDTPLADALIQAARDHGWDLPDYAGTSDDGRSACPNDCGAHCGPHGSDA